MTELEKAEQRFLQDLVDICQKYLIEVDPLKPNLGRNYLLKRGVGEESLLRKFKIGYCPKEEREKIVDKLSNLGHGEFIKLLWEWEETKSEIERDSESKESFPSHRVFDRIGNLVFADRIIFPIYFEDKIVNIYARDIKGDSKFPHLYSSERISFFNLESCKNVKTVIITESIIDALSLIQSGFQNTISLCMGYYRYTPEYYPDTNWIKDLDKFNIKRVFLCFDNDETKGRIGQRMATYVAYNLTLQRYKCRLVILPPDTDINDIYLSMEGYKREKLPYFQEIIDRLLDEAITFIEMEGALELKGLNLDPEKEAAVLKILKKIITYERRFGVICERK